MKAMRSALLGLAILCLSACNSSDEVSGSGSGGGSGRTTHPVTESRDGTVYRQEVAVAKTGDVAVIQVMEPTHMEKGKTYPLVLHGHGYGGSRNITPSGFQQRLRDAGYYVISIDERGNGESSGQVRVMSPDFEGQDLIGILDWAENLEGLRRHGDGRMVVGSYSGSYGGMYQFLLAGADPQQRLRVIAPDITPHDLMYALNSGNVVKSGYGLLLSLSAELPLLAVVTGGDPTLILTGLLDTLARGQTRQDTAIFESLINAAVQNQFTDAGRNFFKYHSVSYFCDGLPAGEQNFLLATPDPREVAPRPYAKIDALITQGFRDTLFNFNDGVGNYECLKARGGDVRLLTHQSGHILPLSLTTVPLPPGSNLETALDPFYTALTLPNFQDAGGSRACGSLVLDDVQFAWFEEKLQGKGGAVNAALPSGKDICLSLAEGDAISVRTVPKGGQSFDINDSTPQLNSVLGVVGAVLGNGAREALLATQPLYTAPAGGAIVAGIPTMSLNLAGLTGAEQASCAIPLGIGACDPILFLGIGHRKAGETRWDLVDDQLTPVRGFGEHIGDMSGIAERLAEGDELALLVYGFHAQYPVTWSRDLLVPALNVAGSVQLPLLSPSQITRQGI
ncbi:alpha/beta hydrolase family protein [Solimonas sp. K1W22B-7]|uniref:alpha/beta hydrolase family protein n=1 Tax=Solimonas sp. K1W22B-7 TaxID=2303331 RepID=UPI001F08E6E8|nr:CocE/NonD family hydrolase [Solimonas sp. K1W22B-7]